MMWGSGWWIFGALFMVVCMVVMARMMMGHGDHGGTHHGEPNTPERTLDNRLARGEIDVEEYERLREALRGTDTTARSR